MSPAQVVYFPDVHDMHDGIQQLMQAHFVEHFKDRHTYAMLPNADEFIVMKRVCGGVPGVGRQHWCPNDMRCHDSPNHGCLCFASPVVPWRGSGRTSWTWPGSM